MCSLLFNGALPHGMDPHLERQLFYHFRRTDSMADIGHFGNYYTGHFGNGFFAFHPH
jgi:hypothetical protein